MIPPQTVAGFFEDTAEAQQVIQLLLVSGFTTEQLELLKTDLKSLTHTWHHIKI